MAAASGNVMKNLTSSSSKVTKSAHNNHQKGKVVQIPTIINKKLVTAKNLASKNNNATIAVKHGPQGKTRSKPIGKKISVQHNLADKIKCGVNKIIPIIQPRAMKAKSVTMSKQEFDELNKLDSLSSVEMADGDEDNIDHDGVELSVNGSDIEDFPEGASTENDNQDNQECEPDGQTDHEEETDTNILGFEPGEIESSDEEETQYSSRVIASKATKVDKHLNPKQVIDSAGRSVRSRLEKFGHLRNDPDFKDFINEVVDARMSEKRDSQQLRRNSDMHQNKQQLSGGQMRRKSVPKGIVNIEGDKVFPAVKSPSDTTIYTPGLRKISNDKDEVVIDKISGMR